MDLTRLNEMIYKRRSVRRYKKSALSDGERELVAGAFSELRPLYPSIRVRLELVPKSGVRTMMPWMPEDAVAIYSEDADGYLENAGFILEQLDLYIQSIGLGSCWVGLGRTKENSAVDDGMKFVILLAVGRTDVPERGGISDFSRKALADISDTADERLVPALLAPSSVNSQPWYFESAGGRYNVYKRNLVRTSGLSRMNRIDVGIALAHLYVSNPEGFSASRELYAPERDRMTYITTVSI